VKTGSLLLAITTSVWCFILSVSHVQVLAGWMAALHFQHSKAFEGQELCATSTTSGRLSVWFVLLLYISLDGSGLFAFSLVCMDGLREGQCCLRRRTAAVMLCTSIC
jgi:hypothetical protein